MTANTFNKACNNTYQLEVVNQCPVCHSKRIQPWLTARDELLKRSDYIFHYDQCLDCSTYFLRDRPSVETISYFYKGGYKPYKRKRTKRNTSYLDYISFRIRKYAQTYLGTTEAISKTEHIYAKCLAGGDRKIIDFGCGAGTFLNKVQKEYAGTTIGMDFNEEQLGQVAKNGHKTIVANEIGWTTIPNGSIDVFRLNHSFEHLHSPHAVLRHIFDKLKNGGILHMGLPNPEGYSARRYKNKWFSLECPRHLILYPPATIESLLSEFGFTNIDIFGQPITKDLARSEILVNGGEDYMTVPESWLQDLYRSFKYKRQLNEQFDRFDVFAVKPS